MLALTLNKKSKFKRVKLAEKVKKRFQITIYLEWLIGLRDRKFDMALTYALRKQFLKKLKFKIL